MNPNEAWLATTSQPLTLKPPENSEDEMPQTTILDLTTIENPQKCN